MSKIVNAYRYSRVNPDIAKNLPTFDFVGDGRHKKAQLVYVCGFGATGSLGLEKFHKPDKLQHHLRTNDVGSPTFVRLRSIATADKIKDMACGHGFTIFAGTFKATEHKAVGFGLNTYSQLGYQVKRPGYPLEIINSPTSIYLPTSEPVNKVSCGRGHSLFLDAKGQVFALGNNSLGQCGRLIKQDEEYFGSKKITKVPNIPKNITNVCCGQDHSMFLSESGQVYACGWGADGQTGLGHFENQSEPSQVKGDIEKLKIVKISCFADTVLALDDKGEVFGWGNSEYSQFNLLAGCDDFQFNIPKHLKLRIPGKVVDVAAGGTMCAVLNDQGDVYVWGFGILGLGPKVDQSSRPTKIPESLFGRNIYNPTLKVTSIRASLTHFAAITSDGDLLMWGKNRGMALGFKHKQDQFFPFKVNLNLGVVKKVALGVDHTCALVENVI